MIDKDTILSNWDLSTVPSPCYVLHETLLADNLRVIDKVRKATGAEIIVALKANAMWSIFPELSRHSDGATASSLAEARLVFEEYGAPAHTYAPVYTEGEIGEILNCSNHITFNSLGQYERFGRRAHRAGVSCGLRVNPEFSTVETDLYNPASPTSRLGILAADLTHLPEGIDGLHFHSLCESRPDDLRGTLAAVEERFGRFFPQIKWLNMGGGHLMTHKDYDEEELIHILCDFRSRYPHLRIILEPGSAFTWDTGCLVATVEDKVSNGGVDTLMLNVSFACHMPDCLEMPYHPAVRGAKTIEENIDYSIPYIYILGANSCLSGDFMSAWQFDHELQIGENIVFEDMNHYTTVKTTMFNGISHPALAMVHETTDELEILREYGPNDYIERMD